jgi:HSP20 family molecular chaperone IbpA
MKGAKGYMDMGTIFDEIFETARNFQDEFHRNFNGFDANFDAEHFNRNCNPRWHFEENVDYYPNYSYPPMNVYMTSDRSMVFEFALAGFDEKDISLSFQGDYMVFSARIGEEYKDESSEEPPINDINKYFKRRLKLKDIEKQKYFVPQDKYAQDRVKAVFKNGILRIIVPPKEEPDKSDGIKIEIIKEGV